MIIGKNNKGFQLKNIRLQKQDYNLTNYQDVKNSPDKKGISFLNSSGKNISLINRNLQKPNLNLINKDKEDYLIKDNKTYSPTNFFFIFKKNKTKIIDLNKNINNKYDNNNLNNDLNENLNLTNSILNFNQNSNPTHSISSKLVNSNFNSINIFQKKSSKLLSPIKQKISVPNKRHVSFS